MSDACSWFPLEHEEIVAWVKAHPQILSASLDTISTLPMPFRKVIVKMVAKERHVALWREHHARAGAADATLTDEQRAFLVEMDAALSEIFNSRSTYNDYSARVVQLFTPAQQFTIFGTLGPPEPPGGLPLPGDVKPTGSK